ncbi:hypothetical protein A359_08660 [secondary endosymbiont of Ctenarytaina eucalypti]|uniref:Uncharacterized protein n=1 Tax=secondary endosymbiont of Ctenarytaina eucalypti TaxID=1199245 RepID=J3TFX5_9ENTR|nr:hypothetical protein A359_08660 [secondary endosymbiont of Ctenarytaina eucalypti]
MCCDVHVARTMLFSAEHDFILTSRSLGILTGEICRKLTGVIDAYFAILQSSRTSEYSYRK